ncbi:MAG: hypothetical protein JSU96_10630 [Acidobacteriota bacterium]|nr:MAG: hypothetical protein JSU96_10630 [Acidobacteriota bacterium]
MEGRQQAPVVPTASNSEVGDRSYPGYRFAQIGLVLLLSFGSCSTSDVLEQASETLPEVPVTVSFNDRASYAIEVERGLAYLGVGNTLQILDVNNPVVVRPLGSVELPAVIRHLDKNGNQLAVACGKSGLILTDVSDPLRPRILGAFPTGDSAEGVVLDQDRAYVAARTDGVWILDTSDPARIQELGRFDSVEEAMDVTVSGSLMYVAASFADLRVVDVSTPANPIETGFADRGSYDQGYAWGVAFQGPFAYIANVEIGLRIVDVQDPYAPSTQAIYPLTHAPVALTVGGNKVYIADQEEGLHIVDTSDPRRPRRISQLQLPGRALDIALQGTLAYIAAKEGGLRIVDVQDPGKPREVGNYTILEDVLDLALIDTTLVAADQLRGVRIFTVSDEGLVESTTLNTGSASIVEIGSAYVVVGDGSDLVRVHARNAEGLLDSQGVPVRAKGPVRDIQRLEDGSFLLVGDAGVTRLNPETPGSTMLQEVISTESLFDRFKSKGLPASSPALVPSLWSIALHGSTGLLASSEGLAFIDLASTGKIAPVGFAPTTQRVVRVAAKENLAFLACDDGLRTVAIGDPTAPELVGYWKSESFLTSIDLLGELILLTDLQNGLLIMRWGESHRAEQVSQVQLSDRPLALVHLETTVYIATGRGGIDSWDLSEPTAPRKISSPSP